LEQVLDMHVPPDLDMGLSMLMAGGMHSPLNPGLEDVSVPYEQSHARTRFPMVAIPSRPATDPLSLQRRGMIRKKSVAHTADPRVGCRVKVPATHPNKYGYATEATIISMTNSRCRIRLDITCEERWHSVGLVRRWMRPHDVESLSSELALVAV